MHREDDLLIWSTMFDGKYAITVTRIAPHRGELTVAEGEKVLHREPIELSFDAQSGPDIDDVVTCHETAIRVVQTLGRP
jgi:hypothetical protein